MFDELIIVVNASFGKTRPPVHFSLTTYNVYMIYIYTTGQHEISPYNEIIYHISWCLWSLLNWGVCKNVCMRQWKRQSLVQIMACRLFGTKPLSELMLAYYIMDPWEHFQWNFNQNTSFSIQGNELEDVVCKISANLPHVSSGCW